MKVIPTPKYKFIPVTIVLESQAEVDALYALSNYSTLTNTLPAIKGWWGELADYTNLPNADLCHAKLRSVVQ